MYLGHVYACLNRDTSDSNSSKLGIWICLHLRIMDYALHCGASLLHLTITSTAPNTMYFCDNQQYRMPSGNRECCVSKAIGNVICQLAIEILSQPVAFDASQPAIEKAIKNVVCQLETENDAT